MTHRRPPPPLDDDATALLQRPGGLSDAGDTDPSRRAPARAEAPTGRFDMGLDDLDQFRPSALPSAYVSEFDVSDLDGDVVEGGAATTIMQLPPEMMGHHDLSRGADDFDAVEATPGDKSIEMMRWRAGPPAAVPADTLPEPEFRDFPSPVLALQPTPLPPVPGRAAAALTRADVDTGDRHGAATMPALSLDMVRAAAAHAPSRSLRDDAPTNTEIRLPVAERLRTAVDDALAAVLAAQSCADAGVDDDGADAIHDHLARAVELLAAAQELGDEL